MRGIGEIEALQALVPAGAIPLFVAITTLGASVTALALGSLLYWFDDRRQGAVVIGAVLLGLAATFALKVLFDAPRPPASLRRVATETAGFPSGHAATATVAYGAIAMTVERLGPARRRYAAATVVIVFVSLSRIVLGVHYLVDVLAGIALGLAVLAAVRRVGSPDTTLRVAGIVAVVGVLVTVLVSVVSGSCPGPWCLDRPLVGVAGLSLGALTAAAWLGIPAGTGPRTRRATVARLLAGAVLGGIAATLWAALGTGSTPTLALGSFIIGVGLLGWPVLEARLLP